jgi:hypothetical protein
MFLPRQARPPNVVRRPLGTVAPPASLSVSDAQVCTSHHTTHRPPRFPSRPESAAATGPAHSSRPDPAAGPPDPPPKGTGPRSRASVLLRLPHTSPGHPPPHKRSSPRPCAHLLRCAASHLAKQSPRLISRRRFATPFPGLVGSFVFRTPQSMRPPVSEPLFRSSSPLISQRQT